MIQIDDNAGQSGRTPDEIVFSILTVADNNSYNDNDDRRTKATKMKIMADVFISFNTATEYLDRLQHDNLIEYHVDKNSYQTTEKGKRLLCNSRLL